VTFTPSFSPVRRATCTVHAGPARATAWLASQKGLFATSSSAVGYHTEVDLENEPGDRKPGRVVWVDAGRDLAIVLAHSGLPRGPEPMAPLPLRDAPSVKSGDHVFSVSALPGRGLRIAPALVCSASPDQIEIDTPLVGLAGGPVLDVDGHAVGLLVRRPAGRALPAADVKSAIRALEASPDLAKRSPVYRCPVCETPFVPEHDACLACGVPLPHPYPPSPAHPLAERAIREALAAAGIVANRARVGPRAWHLSARGTLGGEPVPVTLVLDEAGTTVAFRAPVALAPRGPREPFYRLLLTLNDLTTGPLRLALADERVVLVLALPVVMLHGRDVAHTLATIGEAAEHYRKILLEGFDAAPLTTLGDPLEQ
jgi:hypothetical protein